MKRILSSLLMLTMLLSALSLNFAVQADTQTTSEVYYYNDFTKDADLEDFTFNSTNGIPPMIEDGAMKITKDVYGVSVGPFMYVVQKGNMLDFSSEATPPELVLEMRIKTHFGSEAGYFSSWINNTERAQTFGVNKNGLFRDHKTTTPYYGNYENGQWQTISVVYGNDSTDLTRDVYLNGVKIATFDGNSYAQNNCKFQLAFLPYLSANGQYIMIDYLKIYEKPTSVTAKLLDANADNITVNFSNAPVSVSTNNFSLASGTEINSIDKINETTYRLYTDSDLSDNDTLTVSGITDTLGLTLAQTDLDITFNASAYEGNEYINCHFEGSNELPNGLAQYSTYPYTISDGVLTITPKSSKESGFLTIKKITKTEDTEFVLEFKNKLNNLETETSYMTYHTTYTPMFFYSAYTYLNDHNAWGWTDRTKSPEKTTIDDVTKWHTYAIKYSNTDNTRTLYIDGEYAGETTADTNTWYKNGYAQFVLKLYSTSGEFTSDYEYIKAYSPSDNFTATVLDKEATELNKITLDFNATAANISTANIRVNGKAPASVECIDVENQKYEVTLNESLKPATEYKVALNGVSNAISQETYDVLSFTTKALEAGEAYYTIGNGGIVTANGEEIADGTFAEAAGTIVVKANKDYKAVVKVNGTEIAENNKYGEYTIDTTNGAEIEVTFEEAVTPSFSTPVSFVDESAPDTSYTFVRLNMATDSFGVIVSKDSNKLNAEDADGVTTFILPATNGSNAFGEYGISITDKAEGNKLGNKYYVRPYAKLGDTYYYQTPVTIEVTTVQ